MRTGLLANRDRTFRITVMRLGMFWGAALVVLAVAAPAAAQRSLSDRDLLNRQYGSGLSTEDRRRFDELKGQEAKSQADDLALRQKLLRLPPLPAERNVLLGEWRIEGGGQGGRATGLGQGKGPGGTDAMFRELWTTLESNPDKLLCAPMFGDGISFAPSTYSIRALTGSVWGGSVDYRSTGKQVISAITQNWKILSFEIAGPNRIVFTKSCALVRVGAPAANAGANTATALGNVRTGAANSSAPPTAGALPQVAAVAPVPPPSTGTAAVADGAAFRCADGSLLHVSLCDGGSADALCKLTELHKPGLQMGTMTRRADIAARVRSCEAGGIRYGADDKPIFVR